MNCSLESCRKCCKAWPLCARKISSGVPASAIAEGIGFRGWCGESLNDKAAKAWGLGNVNARAHVHFIAPTYAGRARGVIPDKHIAATKGDHKGNTPLVVSLTLAARRFLCPQPCCMRQVPAKASQAARSFAFRHSSYHQTSGWKPIQSPYIGRLSGYRSCLACAIRETGACQIGTT